MQLYIYVSSMRSGAPYKSSDIILLLFLRIGLFLKACLEKDEIIFSSHCLPLLINAILFFGRFHALDPHTSLDAVSNKRTALRWCILLLQSSCSLSPPQSHLVYPFDTNTVLLPLLAQESSVERFLHHAVHLWAEQMLLRLCGCRGRPPFLKEKNDSAESICIRAGAGANTRGHLGSVDGRRDTAERWNTANPSWLTEIYEFQQLGTEVLKALHSLSLMLSPYCGSKDSIPAINTLLSLLPFCPSFVVWDNSSALIEHGSKQAASATNCIPNCPTANSRSAWTKSSFPNSSAPSAADRFTSSPFSSAFVESLYSAHYRDLFAALSLPSVEAFLLHVPDVWPRLLCNAFAAAIDEMRHGKGKHTRTTKARDVVETKSDAPTDQGSQRLMPCSLPWENACQRLALFISRQPLLLESYTSFIDMTRSAARDSGYENRGHDGAQRSLREEDEVIEVIDRLHRHIMDAVEKDCVRGASHPS